MRKYLLFIYVVICVQMSIYAQDKPVEKEQAFLYRPWQNTVNTSDEHASRVLIEHRSNLMIQGGVSMMRNQKIEPKVWEFAKATSTRLLTRHVKLTKGGDPCWPSALPVGKDGKPALSDQVDLLTPMVAEAKKINASLFAYYFISVDQRIEAMHPEWVCKDPRGKPIRYKPNKTYTQHWLDITGDYREVVKTRLLEMAARGVKGFMFDEIHMPFEGAWGTATQAAWEKAGHVAPKRIDLADDNYRAYVRFMYERVWQTFAYWREAVQQQYPDVVFLVSNTAYPKMLSDRMPSSIAKHIDHFKNEYNLPIRANRFDYKQENLLKRWNKAPDHIRVGFGWAMMRDTSINGPARLWAPLGTFEQGGELSHRALMLYGHVANMGSAALQIKHQREGWPERVKLYQSAMSDGAKIGEVYNGRAAGFLGIYFSERLRDAAGGDFEEAYCEVISPALSWYEASVNWGMPARVILDGEIARLDPKSVPVLLLPARVKWDEALKQAVAAYEKKGGHVIDSRPLSDIDQIKEREFIANGQLEYLVKKRSWPWFIYSKANADDAMPAHVVLHPCEDGSWLIALTKLPVNRHGKKNGEKDEAINLQVDREVYVMSRGKKISEVKHIAVADEEVELSLRAEKQGDGVFIRVQAQEGFALIRVKFE